MADSPPKTKPNYEAWVKAQSAAIERRKNLFEALHKFISQQGGWLVSPPGAREIRIEIPKKSDLPTKLTHYNPRHCGVSTRIVSSGFVPVDVIAIYLSGE
jgi:hypothetical protein